MNPIPDIRQIYHDNKLRNAVAYAHGCCDKEGRHLYYSTCTHPERWSVTEEQIKEAKNILNEAKQRILQIHKNDLLFVSMGCDYDPRYEDDVCNHRIRTEFLNQEGRRFFIEAGRGREEYIHISSSIDIDAQKNYDQKRSDIWDEIKKYGPGDENRGRLYKELDSLKTGYQNYGGLEGISEVKYTKRNLLELVNKTYNCCFDSIFIDYDTLHPSDAEIICYSPQNSRVKQLQLF